MWYLLKEFYTYLAHNMLISIYDFIEVNKITLVSSLKGKINPGWGTGAKYLRSGI